MSPQIHDLKEELKPQSVSETAVAAGLVAGVREDQREQVGEADETEADKQIGGKLNSVGTAPVEDKPSSSPEITLSKRYVHVHVYMVYMLVHLHVHEVCLL